MKLAIAQMVLGGLIVGSGLWTCFQTTAGVLLPLYPQFSSSSVFGLAVLFRGSPGIALLIGHWLAWDVLGLAVLGCGIAQYLKARGVREALKRQVIRNEIQ